VSTSALDARIEMGLISMTAADDTPRIVSQDELDKLDATFREYTREAKGAGEVEVTLYDFRRAYRLSALQIEKITRDCDRIGAALNRTLKVYLNGSAEVVFRSVDRMRSHQYLGVIPDSALIASFSLVTELPAALMHMDRPLSYAAFDLMMGGRGQAAVICDGSPTHIEMNLFRLLCEEIMATARAAGRCIGCFPAKISEIYTSAVAVDVLEDDAWVLCASYQVQIGSRRGSITLGLPSATVQRLLAPSDRHRMGEAESRQAVSSMLGASALPLAAVMVRTRLPVQEIGNLHVGQVINLLSTPGDGAAIELTIAGETKFVGIPGIQGGLRAVQIVAAVPQSRAA